MLNLCMNYVADLFAAERTEKKYNMAKRSASGLPDRQPAELEGFLIIACKGKNKKKHIK